MPSVPSTYQIVGQKARIDRAYHVWKRHKDKTWKCVICGGVVKIPTVNELPDRYEKLTEDEKALCQQR